jgi:leader peptidase (prepilin peptidase)/N-methyltransferase
VIEFLLDFEINPFGYWWLLACALVLGGAVGSFLNVVAYRLPLGMSFNHPGSRCPKCAHPIRWYHNLPVLGWLVLRGRCHDCGAPISLRYPLVELLAAVAGGLVYGSLVAFRPLDEFPAYSINVLALAARLTVVYLLLCSSLLECDDNRLPPRLSLLVLGLMGAIALLLPEWLLPSSIAAGSNASPMFSVAAGLVLGLLSWPLMLVPPTATLASAVARLATLGLVAVVFGGVALLVICPLAALLMLGFVLARRGWPVARKLGWSTALLVATLLWLLLTLSGVDLTGSRVFARLVGDSSVERLLLPAGAITALFVLAARGVLVWWVPDPAKR